MSQSFVPEVLATVGGGWLPSRVLRPAIASRQNLAHISFPREAARRRAMNLAAAPACTNSRPARVSKLNDSECAFCRWLFEQAGLDVSSYRPKTLERRLPACLRALRVVDVARARRRIEKEPQALHQALGAMLIGVTSFFRDAKVFDELQSEILPELLASRSPCRVCSLGCSDGAELYSLAIVLAELGALEHTYLLGADCRPEAIKVARAGHYDANHLHGVSPERLERYFLREDGGFRVRPELRQHARWRVANILRGVEPGIWDVIAFRNVAMYFRAEASHRLWDHLETSLRPGGLLILGKAERPPRSKRFAALGPCLFQRLRR
jgi:chemotaxis methyl-accepting protein methylase